MKKILEVEELSKLILEFFNINEILSFQLISKKFYKIINDKNEQLFKNLFKKFF
jgi:hypothetical protein